MLAMFFVVLGAIVLLILAVMVKDRIALAILERDMRIRLEVVKKLGIR